MFYTLVIGVEPTIVGAALAVALVFDAISDPIVGFLSDNTRTKWGRRHPYMYAAALPVALSYFLLWSPPELGSFGMFMYIALLSITIRTFITIYETPSSALTAELTTSYHERTSILSYRYFFGWTGGNAMSVIMFGVIFTVIFPNGRLNPESYELFGIIGSSVIFCVILISALGTHRYIPQLIKPTNVATKINLRTVFSEIFTALKDKSAISLIIASLFSAVATGTQAALTFTLLTFFWGLNDIQLFIWTTLIFVSAILGFFIAPLASKFWGKKKATVILGILAFGIVPFPVVLRLLGLFPENGDPLLVPLLITINTIDVGLIIAMSILFASMIADLVEQGEIRTKKRSEGIYFAAITFSRKAVQGLGVLVAGIILSLANVPSQTTAENVSPDVLFNLGLYYVPVIYLLWGTMIFFISRYEIDEDAHEQNVQKLADERKVQASKATEE